MFILQSMPTGRLMPAAFNVGSRALLDTVVAKAKQVFMDTTDSYERWMQWARDSAPSSDNVFDYVAAKGFHRPLHDFFSVASKVHFTPTVYVKRRNIRASMPQYKAGSISIV
jgi:hypothetical protein